MTRHGEVDCGGYMTLMMMSIIVCAIFCWLQLTSEQREVVVEEVIKYICLEERFAPETLASYRYGRFGVKPPSGFS